LFVPAAVSELDHGLQGNGIGQGHDPEKFDAPAPFMLQTKK
jgi:hypothetical protein